MEGPRVAPSALRRAQLCAKHSSSMRPRRTTVITHMCTVQTNSVLQINFINLKSLWMHAGAQTSVHVDVSVLCPRAAWLHPRGWEKSVIYMKMS